MEIKKTSHGGKASGRGYEILLFFVTFLWGTTFVAQSVAMDDMPPFAYVFARFLVSAVILLFVTLGRSLLLKRRKKAETETASVSFRQTILGGLITGLALFAASISQQMGLDPFRCMKKTVPVFTDTVDWDWINTFRPFRRRRQVRQVRVQGYLPPGIRWSGSWLPRKRHSAARSGSPWSDR